jgi:hypothetical protein
MLLPEEIEIERERERERFNRKSSCSYIYVDAREGEDLGGRHLLRNVAVKFPASSVPFERV